MSTDFGRKCTSIYECSHDYISKGQFILPLISVSAGSDASIFKHRTIMDHASNKTEP